MVSSCSSTKTKSMKKARAVALLGLIILVGCVSANTEDADRKRGPCDEIYVVGEGESLHTISDKCGDPFILQRNPHINDSDDVFPGLVIHIISSSTDRL
ncbi:hypothetical protein V6N13_108564 [Hibiscus sabdariffa]|uniref:LysM domain-containing protein n=1 Tax=Hibiscus sabdariffa TaxID=183260 RepID=A0ABR2SSJ6_9ROSI